VQRKGWDKRHRKLELLVILKKMMMTGAILRAPRSTLRHQLHLLFLLPLLWNATSLIFLIRRSRPMLQRL
jgi:cation transporter-like permease